MKKFMAAATASVFTVFVAAGVVAVFGCAVPVNAQQPSTGGHKASKYYSEDTKPPQRRGGYSYSAEDTINTYGDSRTLSGGANSYRFELYTRQTPSGPFDHGYFFDSGVGINGGNSPYLN